MGDGYAEFLGWHPGRDLDLGGGLRYHYLDEGEGEPVVMVHGNPTWSFYYRKLAEALAADHRVIAPDHVGCGRSDKPGDDRYDYTLESRVRDLEALLDRLKLDAGLTLVVHDWGGAVGMAFAARHPERVARLVILNTAAFHLPASKRFPRALRACRNTPVSAWLVRGLNAFCRGTAAIGCKHHTMPADVRDGYLAPYDSWANRIAVHRFVQDIPLRPCDPSYDLITFTQDQLKRFVDTPTLIAWGMRDFVFDRHFLAEWERHLPKAEVHRFPLAGHYILEDEAEQVIPLVRSFLAAHPVSLREVG
ncbi:MAG: alpha/beta fold hydrolase [Planctomycetia bacterium]|nr:alpha/beta fold hydrolase [Planctomycetia bacterium]